MVFVSFLRSIPGTSTGPTTAQGRSFFRQVRGRSTTTPSTMTTRLLQDNICNHYRLPHLTGLLNHTSTIHLPFHPAGPLLNNTRTPNPLLHPTGPLHNNTSTLHPLLYPTGRGSSSRPWRGHSNSRRRTKGSKAINQDGINNNTKKRSKQQQEHQDTTTTTATKQEWCS